MQAFLPFPLCSEYGSYQWVALLEALALKLATTSKPVFITELGVSCIAIESCPLIYKELLLLTKCLQIAIIPSLVEAAYSMDLTWNNLVGESGPLSDYRYLQPPITRWVTARFPIS